MTNALVNASSSTGNLVKLTGDGASAKGVATVAPLEAERRETSTIINERLRGELAFMESIAAELQDALAGDRARALTLRGARLAHAILHGIKDVENRNYRLKPGW